MSSSDSSNLMWSVLARHMDDKTFKVKRMLDGQDVLFGRMRPDDTVEREMREMYRELGEKLIPEIIERGYGSYVSASVSYQTQATPPWYSTICIGANVFSKVDHIHDYVMNYVRRWIVNEQFVMPDLVDSLDYMATEAAEAIQARLRAFPNKEGYVRNRPGDADVHDIAEECFDTVMMAILTLELLHVKLEDIAKWKLDKMDEKRRVKDDA